MSESYIGEIRMFAGSFAPRGFAFCDGQLLAVSQNEALFSLFGTIYGGDGRTTFGLPDLRGRVPIHHGSGPGLTPRTLGQKAGAERHTLSVAELPAHSHTMKASNDAASESNPAGNVLAGNVAVDIYNSNPTSQTLSDSVPEAISKVGGSQSHENMQNFLAIHYIVSLFGVYPSRT